MQTQKATDGREQSTPLIQSVKGPDLFRAYCASCHGIDAKGTGPAAPALKASVPDLTLLSRRNLGRFPAAHVREVIVGERVVAAHGSREMPIWGPIFHQVGGDQDWGNVRLENLVKYLASIQSIQAANSSSGVELYKTTLVVQIPKSPPVAFLGMDRARQDSPRRGAGTGSKALDPMILTGSMTFASPRLLVFQMTARPALATLNPGIGFVCFTMILRDLTGA